MRRWKVTGALAVVLFALGGFVLRSQPERITPENQRRLHNGMSRAEVEAILGGPAGDYRTSPTKDFDYAPADKVLPLPLYSTGSIVSTDSIVWMSTVPRLRQLSARELAMPCVGWEGNQGDILVMFDGERVYESSFSPTQKVEQTTLENFLWRAKRQWRKCFPE